MPGRVLKVAAKIHYTEDTLVQQTTAEYLEQELGWQSVYAYNNEDFGPDSLLGRESDREVVLTRTLRAKIEELNPGLPATAYEDALRQIVTPTFLADPDAATKAVTTAISKTRLPFTPVLSVVFQVMVMRPDADPKNSKKELDPITVDVNASTDGFISANGGGLQVYELATSLRQLGVPLKPRTKGSANPGRIVVVPTGVPMKQIPKDGSNPTKVPNRPRNSYKALRCVYVLRIFKMEFDNLLFAKSQKSKNQWFRSHI